MPNTGERRFKRGQIVCKPGEMEMNMYNILYGSVGIYTDYGKPDEVEVVTLREGDFFNVISFLESRPRNTTVVALEPLVVSEISFDNFGKYFRDRPAKVMSLLQHMSARIRQMQKAYVETVVLLSHKKADSYIHIDVEFGEGEGKIPVDSIAKRAEAYKPKEKVTYKMIKEYIEAKYGFKVHTAYIAEVKRDLGLPMYDAPNAVEELKQPKKHPTPEKVEAIKDALRYFAVI